MSTEIFEQNDARDALRLRNESISGDGITGVGLIPNITEDTGIVNGTCDSERPTCHMLTAKDYVALLWITLAEFPGLKE